MSTEHRSAGLSPAIAAVAVAAAFGVGFLSGRSTAPDAPAATPPPPVVRATERPTKPPPTTTAAAPHAHEGPKPAGPPGHDEPIGPAPRASEAEIKARLDGMLQAARATRDMPDDQHVLEAALLASGELEQLLVEDPEALKRALERFRTLTDAADLEALAAVLGRVADPAVEEMALEIARRDVNAARRIAAFDVLDAMDTPAARDLALDVLAGERDPELRRTALRAVPEPAGASIEDAGRVVSTLARIAAGDPDIELRRRAAVDLGAWHTSEAQLAPLVDLLSRDPSPEVRAGAAFGLETARRRSPEVVAALVRTMSRQDEDFVVRENCWRALSALSPLPPDAQAAWQAFKEQNEAALEAMPAGAGEHHHHDEGH